MSRWKINRLRATARRMRAASLDNEEKIARRAGVNSLRGSKKSSKPSHVEYRPIGHSISLAARMQAIAPIGSIAATQLTQRLCEGYFTFKSLGPTTVKGVSEPVEGEPNSKLIMFDARRPSLGARKGAPLSPGTVGEAHCFKPKSAEMSKWILRTLKRHSPACLTR
jgi:hypothetical protein